MKIRLLTLIAAALLALNVSPEAVAQQNKGEHVIADFEGENPIAANKATHTAKVTAVKDVPEGGGKFAAKTVVDAAAKAGVYFGTGFSLPAMDLSGATETRSRRADAYPQPQLRSRSRARIELLPGTRKAELVQSSALTQA